MNVLKIFEIANFETKNCLFTFLRAARFRKNVELSEEKNILLVGKPGSNDFGYVLEDYLNVLGVSARGAIMYADEDDEKEEEQEISMT